MRGIRRFLVGVQQARDEEDFGEDTALADDGEAAAAQTGSGLPWDGSDRDYTYDELLGQHLTANQLFDHFFGASLTLLFWN